MAGHNEAMNVGKSSKALSMIAGSFIGSSLATNDEGIVKKLMRCCKAFFSQRLANCTGQIFLYSVDGFSDINLRAINRLGVTFFTRLHLST